MSESAELGKRDPPSFARENPQSARTGRKKDAMPGIEDMTPEQREQAFQKFLANRAQKQKEGPAKRNAISSLCKTYKDEFQGYLKEAAKTVTVKEISEAEMQKRLEAARKNILEKAAKGSIKRAAQSKLTKAHEGEYKTKVSEELARIRGAGKGKAQSTRK
jgi:hypothetical protein